MIAKIASDAALDRCFDYAIPEALAGKVVPGAKVRVSFGRREITGYVVEVAETSAFATLKPVLGVEGERPFIVPELLALARWMAGYYLAPLELTLRALLPASVRRDGGGKARERYYVEVLPPQEATPPELRTQNLEPRILTKRQAEVLGWIRRGGDGFLAGICEQWKVSPTVVRAIAEAGYLRLSAKSERRNPLARQRVVPTVAMALSEEQAAALAAMTEEMGKASPKPIVLFGVTASGKTEVYLQAIAAVLEKGKGAIVLVPEIALTPQMIQRFAGRFGESVAVLHSQLGDGERSDEWHRIHSGEAKVVVGPRSALFAPVENLGILIVDEEHEPSYKQEETPRYHARDVAVMRGRLQKCLVVLGSATPSLESWHNVEKGKYALVRMRKRIPTAQVPRVAIVDMRREGRGVWEQRGGYVFSRELVEAIDRRLSLGEQVMLFLNRRGYAPSLLCPDCGYVATCEACDLPMTVHLRDHVARCHLCNAFLELPEACPQCGSQEIRQRGIGTQKAEEIVRKLFPRAAVERMDADVTTRSHSHEEILGRFRAGKIDILVGTQMIAKGLDFPTVTLVGVLNADAGLFIPDFRSSERTFQLIAQVAGRSGRGLVPGEVIVQTSSPEHSAIVCAQREDYETFAQGELAERKEASFPPFVRMAVVTFRGEDEAAVAAAARHFYDTLHREGISRHALASEPLPAVLAKIRNHFRYQMFLRAPVLKPVQALLRNVTLLPLPKGIALTIDIDAVSML
ncbi:MAG: primosomal protein N' [Kiritimatiellaeota bacterium]|nr:primosomal protein N' [Kiritimatiellota bacterium]